jgi:hypothetical protein
LTTICGAHPDDDVVDAMTKRNGARPKARRTRRVAGPQGDDRPQGFHPQRMRAVWDTIDQARAKLGPEPRKPPPSTSVLSWAMPARLSDLAPCTLFARATSWIVSLPGIDWIVGFWRSDDATS